MYKYIYIVTPPGLKSRHQLSFTSEVFRLQLCMACTKCGVFKGTPVCGACLAGSRILGILCSGGLPASEERRVTALLRGVAGELSDLVESNTHSGGSPKGGASPGEGETTGRTPGPNKEAAVKKESASPEDSYEEEGEEEQDCTSDGSPGEEEKGPKAGGVAAEPPREGKESKDPGPEGDKGRSSGARQLHPKFDPHYLTKRLELHPTGKAAARSARGQAAGGEGRQEEGSNKRQEDRGEGRPRDHHRDDRRKEEDAGRDRRGRERPVSPDRPPLPRRPQQVPKRKKRKNQKKKNRGQKRKQRGQEFKAWTESRKRQREEHARCHQKRR